MNDAGKHCLTKKHHQRSIQLHHKEAGKKHMSNTREYVYTKTTE